MEFISFDVLTVAQVFMEIKHEKPPNYDKIIAAMPEVANLPHALFTYGNTIFYPLGDPLPQYKIAHEQVHAAQQLDVGVDWWWDMYLADSLFRFNEELAAYRIDYKAFCMEYKDKNERLRYLMNCAEGLMIADPTRNHADVMKLIRYEKARS